LKATQRQPAFVNLVNLSTFDLTPSAAPGGGLGALAVGVATYKAPRLDMSRWAAMGAVVVMAVVFNFELLCDAT
jgi:hypothetical protein